MLAQCIDPFDAKLTGELDRVLAGFKDPCYVSAGTFADAFEFLSAQETAIVGYAHPLEHQSYKKMPSKDTGAAAEVIGNLVCAFKDAGKKKAVFVENYYQSYDTALANDAELVNEVKCRCDSLGLLSTGGMDTHHDSIYDR